EFALNNLANAALHQGDVNRARDLYERVVALANPNDPSYAFVFVSLGDVIDRLGDYESARARYEQAIEIIAARGGDVWASAYAQSSYGQAAARHGDHATAHE